MLGIITFYHQALSYFCLDRGHDHQETDEVDHVQDQDLDPDHLDEGNLAQSVSR